MEMRLNIEQLKQLRESKGWSQSHLADVASLSLRTIQRIEKSGYASPESIKAICAAYDIQVADVIQHENAVNKMEPTFLSVIKFKVSRMDVIPTAIAFSLAFLIGFVLTV